MGQGAGRGRLQESIAHTHSFCGSPLFARESVQAFVLLGYSHRYNYADDSDCTIAFGIIVDGFACKSRDRPRSHESAKYTTCGCSTAACFPEPYSVVFPIGPGMSSSSQVRIIAFKTEGLPMGAFARAMMDQLADLEHDVAFCTRIVGHNGDFHFSCKEFLSLRQEEKDWVENAFADVVTPRVLDIGCGIGRHLKYVQQIKPGAQLSGVEINPTLRGVCAAICRTPRFTRI